MTVLETTSSKSRHSRFSWRRVVSQSKVPLDTNDARHVLRLDCFENRQHRNDGNGSAETSRPISSDTYGPTSSKSAAISLKRWRRTRSSRKLRPAVTRAEEDGDGQTMTRSVSTSSWTEDATTLAPTTPLEPPDPVWTLKLPDAVTSTPSLLQLTHEELRSRGVMPRPTFESTRPRRSTNLLRGPISRTMSIRSALSNFAPHPGVRPLLFTDEADFVEQPTTVKSGSEEYPSGLPLVLLIFGICLSVFVISLDRGIITTAVPSIVFDFHAYSDIGWYGSAYLLTASAFQPLYGRIYSSFDIKSSFLLAVTTFEAGSLVCAVSAHSTVLIVGRAIQGLGSAGVLTGSFVVGTHSVRPTQRPILFAFVGILYNIGALCGPILGGVFSQLTTWRWCFYINLPIGGVTFLSVLCFFKPYPPQRAQGLARQQSNSSIMTSTIVRRLKALDWIGNGLITVACTFLFLALQWSQERPNDWSSTRCVTVISLSGVMFLAFVLWLWYRGHEALIPLHILCQRTVAVSCASAFFIHGALHIHTYYLPIWFQVIKDKSAIDSGIGMIPYILTNAMFSLAAGIFVSKNGLFAPPAIVGCAIGTVGAGILATLQPSTSTAAWAAFQVLVSAGLGMAIQQEFSAVQVTLPVHEVPIGTAAVVASQSAGGAIFVSVGNTLLQNHLFNANAAETIPGVNIQAVVMLGAAKFRDVVPAERLPALLDLYNNALQAAFVAAIPLCGLAFICVLFMEWKSVRVDDPRCRQHFSRSSHRNGAADPERASNAGFSTPELGSDASTLAYLAPRARARWSQKWKKPRGDMQERPRPGASRLVVVPELNSSQRWLAPTATQIKPEGFLAGEMKEVDLEIPGNSSEEIREIGQAVTV